MAFDVITPAQLGRGGVTATIATFYTVLALERVIAKTIDIGNYGITSRTVTVYLVPSGDTASDDNILVPEISIRQNAMFQWAGAQVLNTGDTIQAISDDVGITINISGATCT